MHHRYRHDQCQHVCVAVPARSIHASCNLVHDQPVYQKKKLKDTWTDQSIDRTSYEIMFTLGRQEWGLSLPYSCTPSQTSTTAFLIKKSKHHCYLPHLSGTNNATNRGWQIKSVKQFTSGVETVDRSSVSCLFRLGCRQAKETFQKHSSLIWIGQSSIRSVASLGERCSIAKACSCSALDMLKSEGVRRSLKFFKKEFLHVQN
jgi:hypothetical protein